jgi:molecular chaperone GrpE
VSSHKRGSNRENDEAAAAAAQAAQGADQESNVISIDGSDSSSAAEQIKKLQAENQELQATMLRRQADFENVKKRIEKERAEDRKRGAEVLVEQLIGVLDGFDRALAGKIDAANAEYRKGFELIRGQIWNALSKQGVERIDAKGKEFDPNLHHAIEKVETADHAEGIVVDELAPGYLFHGRVIRPAMVRVAAGAPN